LNPTQIKLAKSLFIGIGSLSNHNLVLFGHGHPFATKLDQSPTILMMCSTLIIIIIIIITAEVFVLGQDVTPTSGDNLSHS
jgi:hypothetical protein